MDETRNRGDRRAAKRRRGRAIAALTAAALVAAACSSDATSSSTSASSTTAASGDSTGGGTGGDQFIADNFATRDELGAGLTIKVGGAMLLSTAQAYYGQEALKGIEIAIDEIAAAGGPTFVMETRDLALSNTAGSDAVREWGDAGDVRFALAAGFFGSGSMIPLIEQYKIITIDPGGGTGTVFQGKPYAWGGRAITPDDALAGVVEYLDQVKPEAKRWAVTAYDFGDITADSLATLQALADANGAEIVGTALLSPLTAGTPNFGQAIDQMRPWDPDVIFSWNWGSDSATFMKQYDLAGMDAIVVGPDFAPSGLEIAGSAFDGYLFAYDYFDTVNPPNPWAAHFVEAFRERHGYDPGYISANYYEDIYIFWEVIQRTLAAGGDITDGDVLQAAMAEDLEFASVYGAGDATGTISFDGDTHTVVYRPMGLFELQDGAPVALAYFNIGSRDFELAG